MFAAGINLVIIIIIMMNDYGGDLPEGHYQHHADNDECLIFFAVMVRMIILIILMMIIMIMIVRITMITVAIDSMCSSR